MGAKGRAFGSPLTLGFYPRVSAAESDPRAKARGPRRRRYRSGARRARLPDQECGLGLFPEQEIDEIARSFSADGDGQGAGNAINDDFGSRHLGRPGFHAVQDFGGRDLPEKRVAAADAFVRVDRGSTSRMFIRANKVRTASWMRG